jgi:hypothetical protein
MLLYLLGHFVLIVEGVIKSTATHLVALSHRHGVIVFGGPRRVDYAIITSCINIIDVDSSSNRNSPSEISCRSWSFRRKCATLAHGTCTTGWILWGLNGYLFVAGDLEHFLDNEIFLLSTTKVCWTCVTPTSAVIGSSLKIVLKVSGPIIHDITKSPKLKDLLAGIRWVIVVYRIVIIRISDVHNGCINAPSTSSYWTGDWVEDQVDAAFFEAAIPLHFHVTLAS